MGRAENDPAVLAAFLDRYLEDAERGEVGPLEDYLERFPGAEQLVRREYAALREAAESEEPGERFGPYRLLEELGRGGQGTVHLALDTRLGRRVALKRLTGLGSGVEATLARFEREARVASRLDHPGICTVHESGQAGGVAFIAMQLVEGRSLAELLDDARAGGTAVETRAGGGRAALLETFEAAARALHAAHQAGVVHRDVKPQNLMVTPDGAPVILDFGLAQDDAPLAETLTRTGDVFGTPAYMAPEQLTGSGTDRRTDVFALVATLYECLTLERPFAGPTREALYRSVLESEPDLRRLTRGGCPDLAVVVATGLAKEPDRRYRTAEDLADELARVREGRPILARPIGPAGRLLRFCRRSPALATTGAAALLFLVAALVIAVQTLRVTEQSRSSLHAKNTELARLNAVLEASLEDARAGRLSKREQEVARLVREGFATLFTGDWRPAADRFEQALALDPDDADARAGLVWYRSLDPDDPLAALEALAFADDPIALLARARVHEARGETEAGKALRTRAASAPTPPAAVAARTYLEGLARVDTFSAEAGPDAMLAALPGFRQAIARTARPRFHYWHALAMAADRADERATVEEALDALVHHWPEEVATWETVAQFTFRTDPARSRAAMHRMLELEPDAGMAMIGLAQHALAEGAADEARAWLDRAVAAAPRLAPARYMRGSLLAGAGEHAAALADFAEAAALDETNSYPLALLVASAEALGGRARVRQELATLAARLPDAVLVRLARARELARDDELEEAVAEFLAAARLSPRGSGAVGELRGVLEARGDPRAALSDAELLALPTPAGTAR